MTASKMRLPKADSEGLSLSHEGSSYMTKSTLYIIEKGGRVVPATRPW